MQRYNSENLRRLLPACNVRTMHRTERNTINVVSNFSLILMQGRKYELIYSALTLLLLPLRCCSFHGPLNHTSKSLPFPACNSLLLTVSNKILISGNRRLFDEKEGLRKDYNRLCMLSICDGDELVY